MATSAQNSHAHASPEPIISNSRQIISSLLTALPPAAPPTANANPLRDLPNNARNLFLTLYTLFEKELLPALDLLDRNLITRLTTPSNNNNNTTPSPSSILLVRSAQQPRHHQHHEHVNYYEVRLDAWSCSCPAFTFAAFPASSAASLETDDEDRGKYLFGGLTRGTDTAVCKHLLACVLVERCEMFAHFVEERVVTAEEIAGWAAGWGD